MSCATLAAYNNLFGARPWHRRWYVPVNVLATGTALSAAAVRGLTAADVGLARGAWRPGRPATRLAAAMTAVWLLAATVPAVRPVLRDKRIRSLNSRAVAYTVLVRIPFGTVLWEEVAFRGVLQAALRRVLPETAAIAAASAVFGIWHIRPTAEALRANDLAASPGQLTAGVLTGVTATAAGGALLSWLRARSGTLAAPALVHLATNCGGPVAAWAATRFSRMARA